MPWEKNFSVEAVLDKVMHAFWLRGYEATSIQDLIACTGINRGSLYATYGDKHTLFLAALRHYDETYRKAFLRQLEANYGPREAIRRQFQAVVDSTVKDGQTRGCFITNTALELSARDPAAADIVTDAQTGLEAFFSRSIIRGQKIGEISQDIDAASIARELLAMFLGLRVLSRSRPEPELLQAIADQALRRLG